MPHSNTIANPDGIKFKGDTPGFANLFFCDFPELLKMGMSWRTGYKHTTESRRVISGSFLDWKMLGAAGPAGRAQWNPWGSASMKYLTPGRCGSAMAFSMHSIAAFSEAALTR